MSQVKRFAAIIRRRVGRSGVLLGVSLMAWYLWVVIAGAASQYALELTSPYIVSPAALLFGIVAGGLLRGRWRHGKVMQLLGVVLIVTAMSFPIYANASAAVGGLFIALIGLGVLDLQEARQSNQPAWQDRGSAATDDGALLQTIVLALTLGAAILLILDSQAAIALTIPVALISVVAAWRHSGPPQWIVVLGGSLVVAGAVLAVVFLSSARLRCGPML